MAFKLENILHLSIILFLTFIVGFTATSSVFGSNHIDYSELIPPCENRPEIIPDSEKERYYSIKADLGTLVEVKVEKGGDYSNCDLRNAFFITCEYCDFENSKIPKMVVKNLANSYLKGADLTFADLEGTNLKNTVFVDADLSDSRIGSDMYDSSSRDNIDFTGADLSRSYVTSLHATWTDSTFKNVKLNEAVISIKVKNLDFSGSDWTNADVLHNGYFLNSNLSNGNFKDAYFIDTTLRNVDFSNSNFEGAVFFNTVLDDVDFSGSKIDNVIFYNVDLSNTNIKYLEEIEEPERNVFCDRHHSCNLLDHYVPPKVGFDSILEPQVNKIQNESTQDEHDVIASFVDPDKDPQHYIDRYNNEQIYRDWFDENYPQYSSIYEAVGLPEPEPEQKEKLPEWVRNIFVWYAENRISEDELLGAIEFLVEQNIIQIEK